MAFLYTNENIAQQLVVYLRLLGHVILTSLDAGRANQRILDEDVLAFATSQRRALVTYNRRDFLKLHNSSAVCHSGLILCTEDMDFEAQANRIHQSLNSIAPAAPFLIHINRPSR